MPGLRAVASRPSAWLAISLVATSFSSASGPGGPVLTPSDLASGMAVLLAGRELFRGEGRAAATSVPALGFWALGAVSLLTALAAQNYPDNLIGGIRFLQLFCFVPLTVLIALRRRSDALILLGGLIGLALVQGALGVVQALTGTGAEIDGERVRAVGTYGAYNIGALADLTALAMIVCLALAVALSDRRRWWALLAAALLLVPLAFSLTRGAWVAAAVAAVVVAGRARPLRILTTVVALGAVAGAVLPVLAASGNELGARVTSLVQSGSGPDQSLIDRFALWEAAREMALDHPLSGVGPHAFVQHRDAYAGLSLLGSSDISLGSDFQQVALESPHNFYLLVASEQGLIAAGVFVVVFLLLLTRSLVRAARRRTDLGAAAALAGAGVLTYQLVSMASADLGGPGSLFLAVCLGLAGWAAADRELGKDRELEEDHAPATATQPPLDRRTPMPGLAGAVS